MHYVPTDKINATIRIRIQQILKVEIRVKSIKVTVMSKKGRLFFSGKNRGDTLSCRPG